MEQQQKSNSSLKAIILILAILLVGSLAYMYKMSTDSETAKKEYTSEQAKLQKQLEDEIAKYDQAAADNTQMRDKIEKAKADAQELLDKVKKANGDVAALQRYKNEYFSLKKQYDKLLAENEQLKNENSQLATQRDSVNNALGESKRYNDTLVSQNENLSKTVEKAGKIALVDLKVEPFKERNSGKLVSTDRARRVDLLQITFTLAANEVAAAGNKIYYVQVIDSKNNVIGEKQTEQFGDFTLTYSFITNAIYQNKTMQVTETLKGKDFEKGLYHVNLFDKDQMVATATFTLR